MSKQDPTQYDISYAIASGVQRPVEELFNLGLERHRQGDVVQAEQYYTQVLGRVPGHADANNLLGMIRTQQGRLDEAVMLLERAIQANPNMPIFHANLGNARMGQGDPKQAASHYEYALRIREDIETLNNFAFALASSKQRERAVRVFERALSLAPEEVAVHFNYANTLHGWRRSAKSAAEHYEQALRLNPGLEPARSSLADLYLSLGKKAEARVLLETALAEKPVARDISAFLCLLSYDRRSSVEEIRRSSEVWARRLLRDGVEAPRRFPANAQEKTCLRIGYVSPDFRHHAAQYFIDPLLQHHDKRVCEVFCYANVPSPDPGTQRMQAYGHAWRDISQLTDEQACELIKEDGIDILVDLAGHTQGNRLGIFALRAAPVQITWFGFPATTGLPGMDYRFTDALIDPPEDADRYTESLWRLDGFYACYKADLHIPQLYPLPARAQGHVTFASLSSLVKLDQEQFSQWADILMRVADSRLLIKAAWADDAWVQEEIGALFARAGVSRERLSFEGWSEDLDDYLEMGSRVDIALDAYPYNGAITSFQAMAMGIPVVSLCGDTAPSRVGRSLLTNLGLEGLSADTPGQFCDLAVTLANDQERLERLRATLPQVVAGAAGDGCADFVRRLEQAYRDMWRQAASGQGDAKMH